MTRLLRRLRYLLQRDRHERELDDELRFHLEMKRQELDSRGLDRAEADAAARRALGNLPLTRDHVRDVWIAPWLQSVAQDVRYGLRTLRRHSGFTAVAVATLALGIGANTAVFSVVNTVLLTPLPYRDSDRLVHIVQNGGAPMTSDGPAPRALAALDTVQLLSFRSQIRSLSHVAAFGITSATLTGRGTPCGWTAPRCLGVAHAGGRLLPTIATSLTRRDLESPVILPRLDEVAIDGSVLVFTVVVSVLTGVLFGVVPALRQARTGSVDVLRQGGGSAASGFDVRGRSRAQGLLVACEVGVALVLCVGSALLIRSFVELADVDPRLRCRGGRHLPARRARRPQPRRRLRDAGRPRAVAAGRSRRRLHRQLPMVRARSLVPLRTTPELPAEPAPPPAPPGVVNPPEWPDTRHVSHDYPDVMGIDVVAGRGFNEGDGPGRQVLLIGIRIALGARRVDVTRSMLGQSAVFIGLGIALGLVGSAAATPWLRGLLFGLGPLDAPTFVAVTIALAGIAALASYLPARRAARADPLSAIRCE